MKKTTFARSLTFALCCATGTGMAQTTTPDAGRILQQLTPQPVQPPERRPLDINIPGAETAIQAGGPSVTLRSVAFSGNTVFSAEALSRVLADAIGKSHDLAGLRALATRISAYYREQGYPFVRAVLPVQQMVNGELNIRIVEGRYGRVRAVGEDASFARDAQPFLEGLKPGDLIRSRDLERAMLILEDLPGVRVRPTIQPGATTAEGDLDVDVQRESHYDGEIGVDNAGNRYTGDIRARATLHINSPLRFGDRISLSGLTTNERMWLGSADYEAPLGGAGWRGQIGYAHTSYALAKEFAYLDARGLARVWSAKLSYPLVRSQNSNLMVQLGYQLKGLEDRYGSTGTVETKSTESWPLALRFDNRDGFAGGGLNYGSLSWTSGQLYLDSGLRANDTTTARREGRFDKINLDASRIQKLPDAFTLYGRYSGQWTDRNLDSSERLSLGGLYGVRAYPMGEGLGDRGWLAQVELRYTMGDWVPYAFFDAGQTDLNARPWDTSSAATRFLSGGGAGVRWMHQHGWNLEGILAWRGNGGEPTSDVSSHQPRVWLMASYRF